MAHQQQHGQETGFAPHFLIHVVFPAFFAFLAAVILLVLWLQQVVPHVWTVLVAYLAANWWWMVGTLLVVLLGGTSPRWVPLFWKSYTAVHQHREAVANSQAYRALLLASTQKMEQGFDVSYKNSQTGDMVDVRNPYVAIEVERMRSMKPVLIGQMKQEGLESALPAPLYPAPFDFQEVLATFRPSQEKIYLAAKSNGDPLTSEMYQMCHVGLGGPTGGGKTNVNRLITSQLLYAGATVYLATPNFAQVKLNGHRLEDWRPIVARLAAPPAREDDEIASLILGFHELFNKRRRAESLSPRRPKDMFLVLGELPGITSRMRRWYKEQVRIAKQLRQKGEDVPDPLDPMEVIILLLREARQYGVHIITEFQDALVNTIGLDSGARENIGTGVYFGGDQITAKLLLKLQKSEKIDERGIGSKGASYIYTKSEGVAQPARIPFFSNTALYELFEYPPDPMPDREIFREHEIPETYHPVMNGRYVESTAYVIVDDDEQSQENGDSVSLSLAQERTTGPLASSSNTLPDLPAKPVPTTGTEESQNGPDLGPDDKVFTSEQEQEFVMRYRKFGGNIKGILRQMNGGEGLSNRYAKYASWCLEKHGLRK